MWQQKPTSRRWLWPLILVSVALTGLLAWSWTQRPRHSLLSNIARSATAPQGPPWIYGRSDAPLTLIEYADLECPYCQAYFPHLKQWIDANPEVNWQWHHLPLAVHQPATLREARLAECAGETGGPTAFWTAVEWTYQHTRSDGQGVPGDLHYPHESPALKACLASTRPDALIRAEGDEAARDHIAETPTLRLLDRRTGKTMVLRGPVEGDALLSAFDLLAAPAESVEQPQSADRPASTESLKSGSQ